MQKPHESKELSDDLKKEKVHWIGAGVPPKQNGSGANARSNPNPPVDFFSLKHQDWELVSMAIVSIRKSAWSPMNSANPVPNPL